MPSKNIEIPTPAHAAGFVPSPARKPRTDGIETRRAILDAAARLATTHGLEALSIGELAAHIGMSKSGLYAHFKSKEELELATIDAAANIFQQDVLGRVPEGARGLERVNALTEAFLAHLTRRVFPGGCFFATVAAQLAAQPGRARDRVMRLQTLWYEQIVRALRQARQAGEIQRDADLDQLGFEVSAMMFRANFAWIVSGDAHSLEQARIGVRNVVSRVTSKRARVRRRSKSR